MSNADLNAFPIREGSSSYDAGLTKRELFAAMAMQGFASNPTCTVQAGPNADAAVEWADALLASLSAQPRESRS